MIPYLYKSSNTGENRLMLCTLKEEEKEDHNIIHKYNIS